ncbi:hypothetical protein CYLTODRAFT_287840 [Cylindrobasidium torrendii FP15055 ss-10]|uniref:Uncharacterized protein n=1 Tax=Cylindrobasidium torrendii FP15055 ss-10 TaxID=1314674 RepID=A0A0D7BDI4_9AGAR|nr:hypothetical protein CYLTODRAFT_287840 [Cylindrobasidium torrendii FP15055 ss-10]
MIASSSGSMFFQTRIPLRALGWLTSLCLLKDLQNLGVSSAPHSTWSLAMILKRWLLYDTRSESDNIDVREKAVPANLPEVVPTALSSKFEKFINLCGILGDCMSLTPE